MALRRRVSENGCMVIWKVLSVPNGKSRDLKGKALVRMLQY